MGGVLLCFLRLSLGIFLEAVCVLKSAWSETYVFFILRPLNNQAPIYDSVWVGCMLVRCTRPKSKHEYSKYEHRKQNETLNGALGAFLAGTWRILAPSTLCAYLAYREFTVFVGVSLHALVVDFETLFGTL